MQPVGELHHNHANVFGHGQKHAAKVLCLLLCLAVKVELGELGNAFYQVAHFCPKGHLNLIGGDLGVFYHVVQESGCDHGAVAPEAT